MQPLSVSKSEVSIKQGIQDLEDALFDLPEDEQIDIDALTTHHFAPGVYARELFIPKGVVMTGKIHKTTHLVIISKGKIAVSNHDGREVIEGPCTFVSYPGAKRAVYALEDTIWTTIHVTEETDLVKIEQQVIANDYAEIEDKS